MSMNEFLNMGGYGIYVWSAYGITFFIFAVNLFLSLQEKKQIKKIIRHYLAQTTVKSHES